MKVRKYARRAQTARPGKSAFGRTDAGAKLQGARKLPVFYFGLVYEYEKKDNTDTKITCMHMPYEAQKFDHLLEMEGFSDQLLKDHFTLYQGYVTNFNKLDEALMAMEKAGNFGTPEFTEMNRRLGWEFNGMRLHELYFSNLTKESTVINETSALHAVITKEFGSYDLWEKDFMAMGAMRGIGWVVLYCDTITGRMFNVWINEHDTGHFAGAAPLLVMDVFEHAYIRDYGIARKDYIGAFMKHIDWSVVEERCARALQ